MNRSWVKRSLVASGVLRLASALAGKGVAIVMYHSVMDQPEREANTLGGIIHSTDVFRGQMELVARHYRPVSLDDAFLFVRGEKDLPARPVVITFDDGYADNYEIANQVLKGVGVPATFYVTVECVQKQALPWPSRLRYAFLTTRRQKWIEPEGRVWPLQTSEQRLAANNRASEHCGKLAGKVQHQFVTSLEEEVEAGPPQTDKRLMMTWEEVRGLVRDGHIVGSHTMTHPNMAYVADSELNREFAESKRWLEKELSTTAVHFSYPCPALQPHWEDRTIVVCREVGYKTAVTASGGLVRRRDNPLCLRRIRPTKNVDGLRWNLECVFMGRKV